MASCSTSSPLSANVLPELLSKFESSSHEACFSDSSLDAEYNDCVSSDLKSLAEKDKKLRELLPFLDAQKRIKDGMKTFLKEKAEKYKKSSVQNDEESEDEESEDGDSDGEGIKIPLFIPLASLLENKAAAMKLEVRSFVFKLWLRRIQLTRQEDKEKYNSLQDFEHAIYNAQEVIKEFRGFIYKQGDNVEELQEMLHYLEDLLQKASSKTMEEKEKASFEMSEEDVVRFCSNGARICALLGLKLDFLDSYEEMPLEDRDHLTLCDWIVTFLTSNYESINVTDKNCLNKEVLASIGFDPLSSAVETIMARAGSTQQHIEACEMAELFIEDEFKYNLLLSLLVGKFPFQSNLTNTWFQLPSRTDEKEIDEDVCHVNIINLVINESMHASRIAQSRFNDMVPEDEGNIVLFHGTDHQSASDILFRGIDLCAGRQKRDFSCGSGFYLTNNFDDALNWANSTTAKPAVLIFQVNRREYLDDAPKLNLYENEERWREIVSSFRSGKKTAKTRKSLGAYDVIEGPAATVTRSESGELVIEPKPSSYQMCLTSEDFADKFKQTLHSIMFLDIC
ncbi:hypothetical protein OS493_020047 [Desmophyllum pertusum]|uniref:Uncharacterized protein n=1 Tax=Desmophyllum pertusum TaxID=174260 RepID=A0A9W9YD46_9CNID|nr:hypothetical protein OS493_020047 [Desmophyllum pertusum]